MTKLLPTEKSKFLKSNPHDLFIIKICEVHFTEIETNLQINLEHKEEKLCLC